MLSPATQAISAADRDGVGEPAFEGDNGDVLADGGDAIAEAGEV